MLTIIPPTLRGRKLIILDIDLIHFYPSLYILMALSNHNPTWKWQQRTISFFILPFHSLWFLFPPISFHWCSRSWHINDSNILKSWFTTNCWKHYSIQCVSGNRKSSNLRCSCLPHSERQPFEPGNSVSLKLCQLKCAQYLKLVLLPKEGGCWLLFHCMENQTAVYFTALSIEVSFKKNVSLRKCKAQIDISAVHCGI